MASLGTLCEAKGPILFTLFRTSYWLILVAVFAQIEVKLVEFNQQELDLLLVSPLY